MEFAVDFFVKPATLEATMLRIIGMLAVNAMLMQ